MVNLMGLLYVGYGWGVVIGDCLCCLLEVNGYEVICEFYYNDVGV